MRLRACSVITVERTPDDSGKYDTHSLHVYKCEPVEREAEAADEGDARVGVAADLTLSAPALDLNVCPVTGRAVVLLKNGVLLVLDCTAAGFELILELVSVDASSLLVITAAFTVRYPVRRCKVVS